MAELRRKLGTLWKRKGYADITAAGTGTTGLGNGPLGTMALGGA